MENISESRFEDVERCMYTKLSSTLIFGDATEFESLTYTCDIESCEPIFQNGLSGKESLWLSKEFDVDITSMLVLQPARISDVINDMVKFSYENLKFLALGKFYFLDVYKYKDYYSLLRIVVTRKTLTNLKKFNPFLETKAPSRSGTLPIVFFKGKWVKYTSCTPVNGKKMPLRIELLFDSVPNQSLCCDFSSKGTNDLIKIFRFFAYLSKYHKNNELRYGGTDKTSLYKLISAIKHCHCNTGEMYNIPLTHPIGCINDSLFQINFGKAFDSGAVRVDDMQHVNALDLAYLKTEKVPYPQTIISVIVKGILEMAKKEKPFKEIFSTFLQHFLTQEAKLTVKGNLIAHFCSL